MLDVSHTSPSTASDALTHSLSPPIFSHSNARGIHAAVRNIPDSILRRIGATSNSLRSSSRSFDGEGGLGWGNDTGEAEKDVPSGDALISLNFSPAFVSEWDDGSGTRATIALLAGAFGSLSSCFQRLMRDPQIMRIILGSWRDESTLGSGATSMGSLRRRWDSRTRASTPCSSLSSSGAAGAIARSWASREVRLVASLHRQRRPAYPFSQETFFESSTRLKLWRASSSTPLPRRQSSREERTCLGGTTSE